MRHAAGAFITFGYCLAFFFFFAFFFFCFVWIQINFEIDGCNDCIARGMNHYPNAGRFAVYNDQY